MSNIEKTEEFYNLCKIYSAEGKTEGIVHGDLQLPDNLKALGYVYHDNWSMIQPIKDVLGLERFKK